MDVSSSGYRTTSQDELHWLREPTRMEDKRRAADRAVTAIPNKEAGKPAKSEEHAKAVRRVLDEALGTSPGAQTCHGMHGTVGTGVDLGILSFVCPAGLSNDVFAESGGGSGAEFRVLFLESKPSVNPKYGILSQKAASSKHDSDGRNPRGLFAWAMAAFAFVFVACRESLL